MGDVLGAGEFLIVVFPINWQHLQPLSRCRGNSRGGGGWGGGGGGGGQGMGRLARVTAGRTGKGRGVGSGADTGILKGGVRRNFLQKGGGGGSK